MYKSIRGRLLKIDISGRILLFFSSLIIFSLLISGFFFQKMYSSMMVEQVSEASMQTLLSISSNIKTILRNVNNSSKIILSNHDVQKLLKSQDGYSEIALRNGVSRTIYSTMGSFSEIASIYLIDRRGHCYNADSTSNRVINFRNNFYSMAWAKARSLQGESYFVQKGGETFSRLDDDNFVSNIRIVNDLETQKPIGALMINVSKDVLNRSFKDIADKHGTKIFLLDDNRGLITATAEYEYNIAEFVNKGYKDEVHFQIDTDNNSIFSYYNIEPYNWILISVMPLGGEKHLSLLMLAFALILLALAILVIIGSYVIAKMITKPINTLVDSMVKIGKGDLKKVKFDTTIKEFNTLRDGYNLMTDEIQSLLNRTISQEKMKRKAELDTLQAQIKPHFLYNTFDSISSLALMGKNEDVYKMVSSLGSFYRISLSKGREVISLSQELEALKNYLDILKLRYKNFSVKFNLEEDLGDLKVLKLILQPFVENSIYHGIKPKGEPGEIVISSYKDGDYLVLEINDDGVGMEQHTIDSLFTGENSFGVRGTIKRINLYYGREDLVEIRSSREAGTSILIKIPAVKVLQIG